MMPPRLQQHSTQHLRSRWCHYRGLMCTKETHTSALANALPRSMIVCRWHKRPSTSGCHGKMMPDKSQ
jgi:hypothetical protein